MKKKLFKALRQIAIVMMGLTAAFTMLSGAGTTCVALAAEKFGGKMALIAPFQWLYIGFVLITLAIGVLGVRAAVLLIKSQPEASRAAISTLAAGTLIGGIHMIASRLIRGSSMPVDAVVYTTIITLLLFLLLRIPKISEQIGFEMTDGDPDLPRSTASLVFVLCGGLTLTAQYWAGPTHIFGGINYADAWHIQLAFVGWLMVGLGCVMQMRPWMKQIMCLLPGRTYQSRDPKHVT